MIDELNIISVLLSLDTVKVKYIHKHYHNYTINVYQIRILIT